VGRANGQRYPLVISPGSIRRGETQQRRFNGINLKPHKWLKNAQTPTSPVHLGMMAGHHFPRENALPLHKKAQKVSVFQEKDQFRAISGCCSENALLAALCPFYSSVNWAHVLGFQTSELFLIGSENLNPISPFDASSTDLL
jgi:hypothetical protein